MTRSVFSDPLFLQRLIAVPFLVLGTRCLCFPGMVANLSLKPAYRSAGLATAS